MWKEGQKERVSHRDKKKRGKVEMHRGVKRREKGTQGHRRSRTKKEKRVISEEKLSYS